MREKLRPGESSRNLICMKLKVARLSPRCFKTSPSSSFPAYVALHLGLLFCIIGACSNKEVVLTFDGCVQVMFNAVLENACSEQGARMSAMDSSSRNAGEMLDRLTLTYNRFVCFFITFCNLRRESDENC